MDSKLKSRRHLVNGEQVTSNSNRIYELHGHLISLTKAECKGSKQELLDAIIDYIDAILNESTSKSIREQIKFCGNLVDIIKHCIMPCGDIGFVGDFTKRFFDVLLEEDENVWYVKRELVKVFLICIRRASKEVRQKATASLPDFYLYKLIDLISSYGDYDFQLVMIELIFCMYGQKTILQKRKDLFPESQELSEIFCSINSCTFDEDVRRFLNSLNEKSSKIFSIFCSGVILGNVHCGETYKNSDGIWVDFNLSGNAVSWYVTATYFMEGQASPLDPPWSMVSFFVGDVDVVQVLKAPNSRNAVIHVKLRTPCVSAYNKCSAKVAEAVDVKFLVSKDSGKISALITKILPGMFRNKFDHKASKMALATRSVYKPLSVSVARPSRLNTSRTRSDLSSFTGQFKPISSVLSPSSPISEVISISDSSECSSIDLMAKNGEAPSQLRIISGRCSASKPSLKIGLAEKWNSSSGSDVFETAEALPDTETEVYETANLSLCVNLGKQMSSDGEDAGKEVQLEDVLEQLDNVQNGEATSEKHSSDPVQNMFEYLKEVVKRNAFLNQEEEQLASQPVQEPSHELNANLDYESALREENGSMENEDLELRKEDEKEQRKFLKENNVMSSKPKVTADGKENEEIPQNDNNVPKCSQGEEPVSELASQPSATLEPFPETKTDLDYQPTSKEENSSTKNDSQEPELRREEEKAQRKVLEENNIMCSKLKVTADGKENEDNGEFKLKENVPVDEEEIKKLKVVLTQDSLSVVSDGTIIRQSRRERRKTHVKAKKPRRRLNNTEINQLEASDKDIVEEGITPAGEDEKYFQECVVSVEKYVIKESSQPVSSEKADTESVQHPEKEKKKELAMDESAGSSEDFNASLCEILFDRMKEEEDKPKESEKVVLVPEMGCSQETVRFRNKPDGSPCKITVDPLKDEEIAKTKPIDVQNTDLAAEVGYSQSTAGFRNKLDGSPYKIPVEGLKDENNLNAKPTSMEKADLVPEMGHSQSTVIDMCAIVHRSNLQEENLNLVPEVGYSQSTAEFCNKLDGSTCKIPVEGLKHEDKTKTKPSSVEKADLVPESRHSQSTVIDTCAIVHRSNQRDENQNMEPVPDLINNETVCNRKKRKLYDPNDLSYLDNVTEEPGKPEETLIKPTDKKPVQKMMHRKKPKLEPVKIQKKPRKVKIYRPDTVLYEDADLSKSRTYFQDVVESFREEAKVSFQEKLNKTQPKEEVVKKKMPKRAAVKNHSKVVKRPAAKIRSIILRDRKIREDLSCDQSEASLKLRKTKPAPEPEQVVEEIRPAKRINIISNIQIRPERVKLDAESAVPIKKLRVESDVEEAVPIGNISNKEISEWIVTGSPNFSRIIIERQMFLKYCSVMLKTVNNIPDGSEEYHDVKAVSHILKKYSFTQTD